MSTYAPDYEWWHDQLPGLCDCDPAWAERGLVDDRCSWHRLLFAVEELEEAGWQLMVPDASRSTFDEYLRQKLVDEGFKEMFDAEVAKIKARDAKKNT